MPATTQFLTPVLALIAWTFVMWAWMYATRIPAMQAAKIDPQEAAYSKDALGQRLPPQVRWKADNYNHLMEQPTLFYATALSLALLGDDSTSSLSIAWAYVALRVVHTLVQTTTNHITTRFAVFFVSSLALFGLAFRAAMLVF